MELKNKPVIDFYNLAKSKIKALKSLENFEIYDVKINKGISQKKVDEMEKIIGVEIPSKLKAFYQSMNGCELSWAYEGKKYDLNGFWDIWSLERFFFGWEGKISSANLKNPFEDILWNDYYEEKDIKELKKHQVLESVEGDGSYVTCKIRKNKINLFIIEEDEYKSLPIDLFTYFYLVIESLGVEDIRSKMKKNKFLKDPFSYKELKRLNKLVKIDMSFLTDVT